jgi:hypothetical protein
VVTAQEIIIENNVQLDGEGNLTLDGNGDHRVLRVHGNVTLSGMTITRGHIRDGNGGGIAVGGRLTLNQSTVSGNTAKSYRSGQFRGNGGGLHNTGTLTLNDSTVSDNSGVGYVKTSNCLLFCPEIWGGYGGGIHNEGGQVKLTNSTVSGNAATLPGGGIDNSEGGSIMLTNSTVSMNRAGYAGADIQSWRSGTLTLEGSLIDGECTCGDDECDDVVTSKGYNLESPGDTCGFVQPTDQVNVASGHLKLEPLRDNGGPTMTHALGAGSVAIDVIPDAQCLPTDQRGVRRPQGAGCDVGAFEGVCHLVDCEDDGNECTRDCNPHTGTCDYALVPDDTFCSVGVCRDGVCEALVDRCTADDLAALEAGTEPDFDAMFECYIAWAARTAGSPAACLQFATNCLLDSGTTLSTECTRCVALEICCVDEAEDCDSLVAACVGGP